MKYWAHRGCSQKYPENTLTAFAAASSLEKLTGIELDVQLTKDNEVVVLHDERVDRTTDGFGFVRDYTLQQLKWLNIYTGKAEPEHIPTLDEVLQLLEPRLRAGFKLNIELKNSVYDYPELECLTLKCVNRYGLEKSIVWSSFYGKSLLRVKELLPDAEVAMLDTKVSDCYLKAAGAGLGKVLHPFWQCMDMTREELKGYTIRAWMGGGHLFPEPPTGNRLNVMPLEEKGITDIILNEPEVYL